MSMIAQSRDLADRRTILDFAQVVQTLDRLKLLLVLTVCDIRAVGPGVWNGWKGQLLRTLYYETEPILTGGFSATSRDQRLAEARAGAWQRGSGTGRRPSGSACSICTIPAYWLRVDEDRQVRHAEFVRKADRDGLALRLRDPADGLRGGDGDHHPRPRSSSPPFRHRRRLRGKRRQHRRCADFHDHRREGARHRHRQPRLRSGRRTRCAAASASPG